MGPQKPLCHDEYYTLYIYTLTIFKKKNTPPKKYLYTNSFQETNTPPQKKYLFKMEANDLFCFASFQFRQKYEKPLFQRSFFNGIWVIFLSGKSHFPASPKMLIYANYRENDGACLIYLIFLFYFVLFDFFIFIYLFVYFYLCVKRRVSMRVTLKNSTGQK